MPPRVAIPMPHSLDREYSERAIVQYERAVEQAGGVAVRVRLDQKMNEMRRLFAGCDALLLPGSKADVDPAKYGAERSLRSAAPDMQRDAADMLLLENAYGERKPVLGICYGLQSLNVFRGGSLVQHIPDFLPEELRARVDHEAGKQVEVAHTVKTEAASHLGAIVRGAATLEERAASSVARPDRRGRLSQHKEAVEGDDQLTLPVNSSHHQSADTIGKGLCVIARCPDDGIIEALEGCDPDHFVLAVQWHPECSIDLDQASRDIFRALIEAAEARTR